MRHKLIVLLVSFFIFGSVVIGCGSSSGNNDLILTSNLIKTEKTLPHDFYELADQGVLAKKVTNQDEFDMQWDYYGFGENSLNIDWSNKAVVFLGVFESGSCPIEFKSLESNKEKTSLIFHLEPESKRRACTDDASPRTFVVAVGAAEASDIAYVEIDNYHGSNPRVKLN